MLKRVAIAGLLLLSAQSMANFDSGAFDSTNAFDTNAFDFGGGGSPSGDPAKTLPKAKMKGVKRGP